MPEVRIENFENVELAPPRLDPGGPYTFTIAAPPELKSAESGKQYLEVVLKVVDGPTQNEEDPVTGSKSPAGREVRDRYYLSEGAAWRIKQLLVSCGLLAKDDSESPMAKGQFNTDILAGQRFPAKVTIQVRNGREYRNYEPML